jgi:hypothetical protein
MARAGSIRVKVGTDPNPDREQVALSRELGAQLCALFGLSAERTTSITITLADVDVARVTVEQFVTEGQAAELVELATEYGLHRAPRPVTLSPGFRVKPA